MLGNPQDANTFVDSMDLGSEHFFWVRPGMADNEPVAAGQKVQVIQATIDACDLRQVSTSDGDEFAAVVSISVQDRTQLFATVVA